MTYQTNKDLSDLNTLRLKAEAACFVSVRTEEDILNTAQDHQLQSSPWFVLGGGSNTLFTKNFPGLVVKNEMKGISLVSEDEQSVTLEVAGGESWPELVEYAVAQNWGGIENLAMIPGTVGAAPVQNIAAYGQNFSDVFVSCRGVILKNSEVIEWSHQEYQFEYRNSIFKTDLVDKVCISSVKIRLAKHPGTETSYYSIGGRNDSLQAELAMRSRPYTIQDVHDAVVAIRSRKLLDWRMHPTVGSFFINPTVTKEKLRQLQTTIPGLQYYPVEQLQYINSEVENSIPDSIKIPVGRLLDALGWRGKRLGHCAVHDQVASIFTHDGEATGQEFLEFTNLIKADVVSKLGIELVSEVKIL